ncbi:CUB domain-containing protein 1-like [Eucyclogobius newberryi]|uniref:CUB domain-containing protein 1-like n=1 Tax=Eucyclogobius newberryi TaxID=166745 RepID=UPI003B5B34DA
MRSNFVMFPEVQKVELTLDSGTELSFSSSASTGSGCEVCEWIRRSRTCKAAQAFSAPGRVSVELECVERRGAFNVEIARTVVCPSKSCSGDINTNDNFDALFDLNRRFVWSLIAAVPHSARVDFGITGLRQIQPSQSCPDRHIYTYGVMEDSGTVLLGRYCRTGPITKAQARGVSWVSLELPAGQKLQDIRLEVSVGEEIRSLAKMSVSLPRGPSSLELLSPNYPGSFPDDKIMEWHFEVPAKHQASIQLLNVTQPQCLDKRPGVEYHNMFRFGLVAGLTETQPVQREGEFTMTLRNCKMDRRRANSPGLSMGFKVSTATITQVRCEVELNRYPGLSLHLKKLNPASDCIMRQTSKPMDQTTLKPGSTSLLLFEDCQPKDIQVTATQKLGCYRAITCPRFFLAVPSLPECLIKSLSNMTWALNLPQHGTAELGCASGTLVHVLPGQPCNDSISMKMAEDDGSTIGTFCRNGPITKLQIHTNISITVTGTNGEALTPANILTARIKDEISESFIFRVSPEKNMPLFLATPGWPKGMNSDSTVSWLVTVPPKMKAHLTFTNLSQPKCSKRHTEITIRRVGQSQNDYSRREDEKLQHELTVSGTFFLNMSNCLPEKSDFSVFTKVTLHQSQIMTIIVSIVAVLLALFIVILLVACLVIRKKKRNLNPQTSIYNANGTSFLPGQNGFPRSQEDDESHVYEEIDEGRIYYDILRKRRQLGVYGEAGSHTDSQIPLVARESGTGDAAIGTYQDFLHEQKPELPKRLPRHMQTMVVVDNDLYETEESEEASSALPPQLEPDGEAPDGGE